MTRNIIGILFAWALLASPAHAAPDPFPSVTNPRVVPNPATAGAPVSYRILFDGCGSVQPPVITRAGEVVTVRQSYGQVCGLPPPPFDIDFPLGTFAAGQYTLVYISRNSSPGFTDNDPIVVPFGVVAPATVPTDARVALALLVLSVLTLAARRFRARES